MRPVDSKPHTVVFACEPQRSTHRTVTTIAATTVAGGVAGMLTAPVVFGLAGGALGAAAGLPAVATLALVLDVSRSYRGVTTRGVTAELQSNPWLRGAIALSAAVGACAGLRAGSEHARTGAAVGALIGAGAGPLVANGVLSVPILSSQPRK